MTGTQAVSRGAYSIKTVALAFNFLKTWPSFSRSESHCRFASISEFGRYQYLYKQLGQVFFY